jgi:hypothetical protein
MTEKTFGQHVGVISPEKRGLRQLRPPGHSIRLELAGKPTSRELQFAIYLEENNSPFVLLLLILRGKGRLVIIDSFTGLHDAVAQSVSPPHGDFLWLRQLARAT